MVRDPSTLKRYEHFRFFKLTHLNRPNFKGLGQLRQNTIVPISIPRGHDYETTERVYLVRQALN